MWTFSDLLKLMNIFDLNILAFMFFNKTLTFLYLDLNLVL